jgi:hypothetical protein
MRKTVKKAGMKCEEERIGGKKLLHSVHAITEEKNDQFKLPNVQK